MHAFLISLIFVFLAELGDKTQLVALCLATRYKAKVVLAGIFVATLLVHVVSVLLGAGVGKLLPEGWIKLAAGVAFIGFGLWTLRGDSMEEDECKNIQGRSPFFLVATTFFLAELGDKTMLTTVALAANNPIIPVWLGSTMGMVFSDGLAIVVGTILGAKLPERAVKIGASVVFFGFGAFSMVQGGMMLPAYAWAVGAGITALLVGLFIHLIRKDANLRSAVKDGEGTESELAETKD